MDFRHSDRALDWHARVRRFLDEQVIPREAEYFAQVRENPNRQPPAMEAMKAAAEVPGLLDEPRPFVRFIPGFGDHSLDFTLICQVASYVDQYAVQHELRSASSIGSRPRA